MTEKTGEVVYVLVPVEFIDRVWRAVEVINESEMHHGGLIGRPLLGIANDLRRAILDIRAREKK